MLKIATTAAALLLMLPAQSVFAQQAYPAKQIRLIVPLAAGGNLDLVARAVAQQVGEGLGQRLIVENRPGSSSLVGTLFVQKAPADGYTLLAMANTFATVPLIVPNAGYDPLKDFAGVSLTCIVPQVLVVNPALPVRTVKELVALAKARPEAVSFASSGPGSIGHMAAVLFNSQAGTRMLHVPYKGNSQAIIDVMGGQVAMMFDQVSTSTPHIKGGKLRALGVSSRTRSALLPEVPTIDAAGVAGYESITFNGLMAPAGTPREVLARLNQEVAKAVRAPELHQRFIARGVELTASATPEAFGAYVKAEVEKMTRLARAAGLRQE